MATVMAVLMFGGALGASVWAMIATIRPEYERIADLLKHGPVVMPDLPAEVAARASVRIVSPRPVRLQTLRAVA